MGEKKLGLALEFLRPHAPEGEKQGQTTTCVK